MQNREKVKDIVRDVEKLMDEAYSKDNMKTEISFDLLCDILKTLVTDYNIKKTEL